MYNSKLKSRPCRFVINQPLNNAHADTQKRFKNLYHFSFSLSVFLSLYPLNGLW